MSTVVEGTLVHEFYVRINDGQMQTLKTRTSDSYLAAAAALATLDYEDCPEPIVEILNCKPTRVYRYSDGQLTPVLKIG